MGPVDDPLEREADAWASAVMAGRSPQLGTARAPLAVQRRCDACEEERTLRRSATSGGAAEVPPATARYIAERRGGGAPLPETTRAFFETRFGRDFSSVRVHADGEAARSAAEVDARAYTVGSDIVFGAGAYAPETRGGRMLIAHELSHVLQQQAGVRRLQRAVTRGAGGCAAPDALDEDDRGPLGAGRRAHTQIQAFLLPRILREVRIPRATKARIDSTDCQADGVPEGSADLYLRGGSTHEIAEIKPIRQDMSHAVRETDHYMLRARQSFDRFFGTGAMCPGAASGTDDIDYARDVQVSRLQPGFARMTGILSNDTVIGEFEDDRSKTLKARLHSPGAVGYWCTGGRSDTFTCGASDREIESYIDRVALAPAQSALDEFLRVEVQERLERALASRNLGDILEAAERNFGGAIREQLRPLLGPAADTLISRASAREIGRLIEESVGPEARNIVTTLARRFTERVVSELRSLLNGALRGIIRDALAALCVGVPVVTIVELIDRIRSMLRDTARQLAPVAVTQAVALLGRLLEAELQAMLAEMAAGLGRALGAIGEALQFIGDLLLRFFAALAVLLLIAGVVFFGALAFIAIFDPAPGDEVALAGVTAALARLIPTVGRFVISGSAAMAGAP